MGRRIPAALAAMLALGLIASAQTDLRATTLPPHRNAGTVGLPTSQLHFGLANDPGHLSWMTGSGVPWRYRYQYLSAGVNTGSGWETWNSPTGSFATFYMNASNAAGYIPVFSYYELLQSKPSVGADESSRDYSNLNNASTMASYYNNFKLLMQLSGTYGKPVVVHVEPDLWGYLEQRAAGGDASTLTASVASSGVTEASGLPNTAQGFAWALLKLRDLYAPNAILAIHASTWGSGIDIASDTNASVNATSVADATASFLNSAGIASNPYGTKFDLVFNDVDDHDAGWWEQQGADNAYFTHWWDPTNARYPNFNRYLAWVAELKAKTERPQVVWQVPVGNQYFLTMNNTCGHYQDNVAPYFISHATDLFAAGLIAVLFGAGNGCQTSYFDAVKDGVTNNGGAPTTDLLGGCNACNTQASVQADDDGGYLRQFVGMYYSGWTSLDGVLTSRPGASSWGSTHTDAFVRGLDGQLFHDWFDGTAWRGFQPLGGALTSGPAALSWGANRIDVFARGGDGELLHTWWDGVRWNGWQPLGGALASGPAVSSWAVNRLDVFTRGGDGQLWHTWWDGLQWNPWQPLGGQLASDPAAVSWGPNRIDVFGRGTDNELWHTWWDGGRWNSWQPLGGILVSAPAASSCASGHLDVFVLGGDSAVYQLGYNGTAWLGWKRIGGQWTSDPGAVCPPGGSNAALFERGPDSALWYTTLPAS